MTFANIQQISIVQGPLQRLLGIADLMVRTAGGGGSSGSEGTGKDDASAQLHVAFFRGVDNAPRIRDLMQEHLRRLRGTGLGDTDEADESASEAGTAVLEAARELRREAVEWRRFREGLSKL